MVRFMMIYVVLFLFHSLALAEPLIQASSADYKRPLSKMIEAQENSGGARIDQIYENMSLLQIADCASLS